MNENERITEEMIQSAKNVSLSGLARSMGYTVKRVGKCQTLKEMDSVRIYDDCTWNRFSGKGNINGGSAIDFLMEFGGFEFKEAVRHLAADALPFARTSTGSTASVSDTQEEKKKKEFELPDRHTNFKRLYAYLMKERGLSKEIIDFFVKRNQLYEEPKHHNIVFLGYDKDKNIKYATLHGTYTGAGKSFRGDVGGSNKNYNFNLINEDSPVLHVFESCIDMMSYMQLKNNFQDNFHAMGMVSDNSLVQLLKDYSHIRALNFHLDNDEAALKALYYNADQNTKRLYTKYLSLGYDVTVTLVPKSMGKDVNDMLLNTQKAALSPEIKTSKTR